MNEEVKSEKYLDVRILDIGFSMKEVKESKGLNVEEPEVAMLVVPAFF